MLVAPVLLDAMQYRFAFDLDSDPYPGTEGFFPENIRLDGRRLSLLISSEQGEEEQSFVRRALKAVGRELNRIGLVSLKFHTVTFRGAQPRLTLVLDHDPAHIYNEGTGQPTPQKDWDDGLEFRLLLWARVKSEDDMTLKYVLMKMILESSQLDADWDPTSHDRPNWSSEITIIRNLLSHGSSTPKGAVEAYLELPFTRNIMGQRITLSRSHENATLFERLARLRHYDLVRELRDHLLEEIGY